MRRMLVLMALLGVAVGLAAEWSRFDGDRLSDLVPDLVTGWVLIASGIAVLARDAKNRCGWLLGAGGVAWFAPNFADVLPGSAGSVAAASLYLHRGFLVHLLLVYPNGRSTRAGRWVIAAGYGAAVTPVAWGHGQSAVALSVALIVAAAARYRLSVGPDRRARRAALVASCVFGLLVAAVVVVRMSRHPLLSDGTALRAYEAILVLVAIGLAAGVLLSWWRPDVTDLVVELSQRGSANVHERLAQALGDPDLRVGYWLPESGAFVDFEGRPLPIDAGDEGRRATTLVPSADEPVAAVIHDTALLDQPAVLEALTAAGRLAAASARLRAEVQARVNETVASRRRIVDAGDEERERLGRRLRDGAERHLDGVGDDLRRAHESVRDATLLELIRRSEEQLARTRDDLIRLARGLHPRALSDLGLAAALAHVGELYPLQVTLDVAAGGLAKGAAACAYFVCSEALANAAKHASASTVRIVVEARDGWLHVAISDDGVGGADLRNASGLRGLADRVEALGGTMTLSSPPGAGTVIDAVIPNSSGALHG